MLQEVAIHRDVLWQGGIREYVWVKMWKMSKNQLGGFQWLRLPAFIPIFFNYSTLIFHLRSYSSSVSIASIGLSPLAWLLRSNPMTFTKIVVINTLPEMIIDRLGHGPEAGIWEGWTPMKGKRGKQIWKRKKQRWKLRTRFRSETKTKMESQEGRLNPKLETRNRGTYTPNTNHITWVPGSSHSWS